MVLDIIQAGEEPGRVGHEWLAEISVPRDYMVRARCETPHDSELSDYEVSVLQRVADTFCGMDRWDLVRYTRTLPEWKDNRSGVTIEPEALLRAAGKSDEDIERIAAEAEADTFVRQLAR